MLALITALGVVAVPRRGTQASPHGRTLVVEAQNVLTEFRGAIDDFRRDQGAWPGSVGGVTALELDLLDGQRPYLTEIPTNPVTGRADVRVLDGWFGTDRAEVTRGESGWVYDPARGRVWLDAPGDAPSGTAKRRPATATRWMDL